MGGHRELAEELPALGADEPNLPPVDALVTEWRRKIERTISIRLEMAALLKGLG